MGDQASQGKGKTLFPNMLHFKTWARNLCEQECRAFSQDALVPATFVSFPVSLSLFCPPFCKRRQFSICAQMHSICLSGVGHLPPQPTQLLYEIYPGYVTSGSAARAVYVHRATLPLFAVDLQQQPPSTALCFGKAQGTWLLFSICHPWCFLQLSPLWEGVQLWCLNQVSP